MTDRQLRGYFTWRARVRAGQVEQTAASFAYAYLYELLMGIGVEPGRKAFGAIEAFWKTYRQFDPGMDRYVPEWLVDYVVEHDLPAELAVPYAHLEHDAAIAVLERAEKDALAAAPPKGRRRQPTDFAAMGDHAGEFAQSVCQLSSYRLDESRLYKERPEDVSCVLLAVYSRLTLHYRGSRTQGLTETLFGLRFAVRHVMYASAVRYEPGFHEDCVYELSPTRRYVCKNGLWSCDSYHDGGARSAKLGQIVRAVDRQLRQALGYAHPLKDHAEAKYLVKIIDDEIAAYLGWKQAAAPRRVEIDLSKLAGIRSAAAVTREALLVDEEREDSAALRGLRRRCPWQQRRKLSRRLPRKPMTSATWGSPRMKPHCCGRFSTAGSTPVRATWASWWMQSTRPSFTCWETPPSSLGQMASRSWWRTTPKTSGPRCRAPRPALDLPGHPVRASGRFSPRTGLPIWRETPGQLWQAPSSAGSKPALDFSLRDPLAMRALFGRKIERLFVIDPQLC